MKRSSHIASLGVFLSLAMIAGYIETLIPINFGIPGMKLGLANMVTVILMYLFSPSEAFLILVIRILLSGFLFGNGMSFLYSLSGGILSFIVMYFFFRTGKARMISLSVIGAISHNAGQLICACIFVSNMDILFYMPILAVSGIITGLITGSLSAAVHRRLKKGRFSDKEDR